MTTAMGVGAIFLIIILFAILGVIGELLYAAWKVFGFVMNFLLHGFLFLCSIGVIGLIGYLLYQKVL